MPTTPNYGQTYITPLDPAYSGIWGPYYNNLHIFWDQQLVTRTRDYNFADYALQRPTLKDYGETYYDNGNVSGSVTIDLTNGNHHKLTLTGNVTSLTISNPSPSGNAMPIYLYIKQDSTGSRTVTWPASFDWGTAGSPTLTTTANKGDIIAAVTKNAGTNWYPNVYNQGLSNL